MRDLPPGDQDLPARARRTLRHGGSNSAAGGHSGTEAIASFKQSTGSTASLEMAGSLTVPGQAPSLLQFAAAPPQEAAARGARLRELRWKNSAWLATADTIAGWNGFEIRKAGSGRSPVRKRSG